MSKQPNILIDYTKWLLKWIGIVIVGLIGLWLVIAAGMGGYFWITQWRHEAKIKVFAENDRLKPESDRFCKKEEFPILVGFANNSSRTVGDIAIEITARLPNRSTDILHYDDTVRTDYIVKSGERWVGCFLFRASDTYKDHPDFPKAIYEAKLLRVGFE